MKTEKNLDSLLEMVRTLSEKEQSALAERIMDMLSEVQTTKKGMFQDLIEETNPERPDCPHCAAKASLGYIVKRGRKNGNQRYYCKSCGKFFVSTTNTAFAWTKKDADTWRKFIRLTITGKSLHECKDECGIAYQTAFTWRHKILNAFAVNQEATKMSGNVEVDEMLIPVSYKGNHIQGAFGTRKKGQDAVNNMPREGFKRGTDNISRSSKEKACVFCMVENSNKAFYASVPGVGFMDESMLDHTIGKHVDKEKATLLADEYKVTKKYFEEKGYKYMIFKSNTSDNPHDHKPEVRDGLHIQHVNSMHQHIRKFLRPYCGVSSKYLSNYISLFIWLKTVNIMKQKKSIDKVSVARAAAPDCYVSWKTLLSRPSVPQCA